MVPKFYSKALLIVALLILLIGLLGVTRARLPSAQIEKIRVSMDASLESSSQRGRALDALIGKELDVSSVPHTLEQLQKTEHVVSVRRLWMHRCEVNQRAFEDFLVWHENAVAQGTALTIKSPHEPQGWQYASSSTAHRIAGRAQSPASGVSYFEAYAYCRASGGRLPTANEWLAVTSGREGHLYPWGDTFEGREDAWPYRDGALNAAQICGLHGATDTPEDIHDLANGVMEWGAIDYSSELYERHGAKRIIVQGASPSQSKGRAIAALNVTSNELPPDIRSHQVGFRCVYNRQPSRLTPWNAHHSVSALDAGEYLVGSPADARLPRLLSVLSPERLREINLSSREETWAQWHIDVGRCEIRRKHYQLFLRDPLVKLGLFANESEPDNTSYVPAQWKRQLLNPELPVVGINWWSADAFARWVGGRLPSVEEWRVISSGRNLYSYPWGDKYDSHYAMNAQLADASVVACGTFEHDTSTDGVHDMGANVSEWTRSLTADTRGYLMWVKGGSYLLPGEATALNDFQRAVPLDHRNSDIGFRVVFD